MKYIFAVFIFLFLAPLFSFANETLVPGNVFTYYHESNGDLYIDVEMPFGNNGSFVFVNDNDYIISSSTIRNNSPFAQIKSIKIPINKEGTHEVAVELCSDKDRKFCSKSITISIVYKGGVFINENQLGNEDLSINRQKILQERENTKYKDYVLTKLVLQNNIKKEISKNYLNSDNVIRVKKVFEKNSLSSIIFGINDYSLDDFYKLISTYPSFCNEARDEESLESACAREVAALFSFILYFSNNDIKNEYQGLRQKSRIFELVSIKVDSDTSSKEIFEKVLDKYMRDSNPKPSAHNALLSLYIKSNNDIKNGIENGFGATVNIMTGNSYCGNKNILKSKSLSELYKKILSKTKYVDNNNIFCGDQTPFSVWSNAFYPQYYKYNSSEKRCVLSIFDSVHEIKAICDISKDITSNKSLKIISDIQNSIILRDKLSSSQNSKNIIVDKKTTNNIVIITYPYFRAYDSDAKIYDNIIDGVNQFVYEGLLLSSRGDIEYYDKYSAIEMPYMIDCLDISCPLGFLNQLKSYKQKNKNTDIVVNVDISDLSIFHNKNKSSNVISQIKKFLEDNSYISGISFTIDDINSKEEGESLRKFIVQLKSKINENSRLYLIGLRIPSTFKIKENINYKDIFSLLNNIYILSYNNHLTKEDKTAHNAQLLSHLNETSIEKSLIEIRKLDVPLKKIIVGIPYFGQIWQNISDNKENTKLPGLFSKHSTKIENTYIDYKTIASNYLMKGNYEYHEDELRGASYVYDGETFISYDSPEIILKKTKYLNQSGVNGIMFADYFGGNDDLYKRVSIILSNKRDSNQCKINRSLSEIIKEGDSGADVYAVQEYLKCLAYLPSYKEINGYFDAQTKKAVLSYEKDNDLKQTGEFNKKYYIAKNSH